MTTTNTAQPSILSASFLTPKDGETNGFKTSHRKERGAFTLTTYTVINPDDTTHDPLAFEVITLRIYSTSAKTTACAWSRIPTTHITTRGSGQATGCGYHRPSSAAEIALTNAGFTLSQTIDGRGDAMIKAAVIACARALGCVRPLLVIGHA